MKSRTREYIFIVIFVILVFGIGMISIRKLTKFYINQEIDYNEWTPELGSKFETDIASTFYNKVGFVNLNGAICRFLKQPKMNGVVKLNNGYLLSPMPYTSDEVLREYADSTIKLNSYLREKGIYLCYVSAPYTLSKYDSQLPYGIEDYGNDNIDRFLEMLTEAGVDIIDIRQTMYEDGINQYDMMYKTDHHWTTEAGFYAYEGIEKYIEENTGCTVDERISDISNYNITKYEKWHLGSNGQRTGKYYAGIDDFDLIIPNFETELQNSEGKAGSMKDMMIDMGPLQNKDYTSRYTYDYVLGTSLCDFQNLNCKNDVSVLFITDSFGKAVAPYISIGFCEMNYVYNGDSSVITPEFIESINPDVVVMLYYPARLQEGKEGFSFEGF